MCGIVGALDLRGRREFSPSLLARMAAAVRHRGPDDAGAWSEPGVALGAQRLAIVDVAGGRQPVLDPAGRVVAACNGELFNQDRLRRELGARGHQLRTRCDTELWPALYLDAKERVFERAEGQFAAAIWDREARVLLLGRDRLGICPLFHAEADGWLLWASEIKGILASGLLSPEADLAGLDHVFSLFAAGTQRTCFRGIHSLLPGHFLRVQGGEIQRRRYWDLDFPDQGEERVVLDESALAEELESCLESAVSRRLQGDGPVTSYLSGGLDSTLVLGLARRAGAGKEAFTVGSDPAEMLRASRSAAVLGTRLQAILPTAASIVEALPGAVEAAEGPIMDTANACLLLLAQEVRRRGFKVALSGEGADEAMGGYVWHKTAKLLRRLGGLSPRAPAWLRETLARIATPGTPSPGFSSSFSGSRPALLDIYEPLSRGRWLLYSDSMARQVADHDPFADLDVASPRLSRWDPLHQSLYLEYKLFLPGHLLLGKGDRVAMRAGVEGRFPFLDEAFIELTRQLAPRYKLRGMKEKWLLREVSRRVLPAPIASSPKGMFKADPLCSLLPRPRWVEQLLSPGSLRATGYFSVSRVRREQLWQRLLPAVSPRRFVVDGSFTALVMTQLWHHLFLGGGLCDLPVWAPPPALPLARIAAS